MLAGCGSAPAPVAPSVASSGEPALTGLERMGWTQPAADAKEAATLGFAVYVDATRVVLPDVACSPDGDAFACSAQLPGMSSGSHTLELATFFKANPSAESARSAALRVTIAALSAPADDGLQPTRERRMLDGPASKRGQPDRGGSTGRR